MFSGLVESLTQVRNITREPGGVLLEIERPAEFDDIVLGASIAIDGCCLTVVEFDQDTFQFQAGEETLSKTTLGELRPKSYVNCERSLQLGDRLGGHLVSGHVDAIGQLASRKDQADWSDFVFEAPKHLLPQMAPKGSITVNGVSLTLVDVTATGFSIALIPHTLSHTNLGALQPGNYVNLETDILAKYVQQQLAHRTDPQV